MIFSKADRALFEYHQLFHSYVKLLNTERLYNSSVMADVTQTSESQTLAASATGSLSSYNLVGYTDGSHQKRLYAILPLAIVMVDRDNFDMYIAATSSNRFITKNLSSTAGADRGAIRIDLPLRFHALATVPFAFSLIRVRGGMPSVTLLLPSFAELGNTSFTGRPENLSRVFADDDLPDDTVRKAKASLTTLVPLDLIESYWSWDKTSLPVRKAQFERFLMPIFLTHPGMYHSYVKDFTFSRERVRVFSDQGITVHKQDLKTSELDDSQGTLSHSFSPVNRNSPLTPELADEALATKLYLTPASVFLSLADNLAAPDELDIPEFDLLGRRIDGGAKAAYHDSLKRKGRGVLTSMPSVASPYVMMVAWNPAIPFRVPLTTKSLGKRASRNSPSSKLQDVRKRHVAQDASLRPITRSAPGRIPEQEEDYAEALNKLKAKYPPRYPKVKSKGNKIKLTNRK